MLKVRPAELAASEHGSQTEPLFWNFHLQSFFLASRVNEFGVSAEMLEKREVESPQDPNNTTPALEGTQPEVEQSVQAEAPKPKQKSKKAKKVD